MPTQRPIDTAPKDGSRVTVYWTDRDGQENQSIAQYRSPERLKALGSGATEADAGWWAFVDSDTQKRITPHGWAAPDDEADD